MSELTKFECDATGETFGVKNHVYEFEIRRILSNPFEIRKRDIHLSSEWLREQDFSAPHNLQYVGVDANNEVVGVSIRYNDRNGNYECWEDRGGVMVEKYELFFEFVEEEIIY